MVRQLGKRRAALLPLLACCLVAACASVPKSEPRTPFLPYQLAPQSAEPAASAAPPRPLRATVALDETAAPVRVDETILRFAVEQRTTRIGVPPGRAMPEGTRRRWREVLAELDRFLRQPPQRMVPLDLVRARVGIEAELSFDLNHYSELPIELPAAVKARAMALDLRLRQARKVGRSPTPRGPSEFTWPLEPVLITSLFGMRNDPFSGEERRHRGVDLKARVGQLVQAAAPGLVVQAGRSGGHGLRVDLLHDDGSMTRYSHLSMVLVSPGMRVPTRGPVGLAGNTGRSTGPHLHFEVWRGGRPVDPLSELADPAFQELGDTAVGDGN